jgi:hypothetical protein
MAASLAGTYNEDLAYIHDTGFRDFSLNAAKGLLPLFRREGIRRGFVVDLGCGSGWWARASIPPYSPEACSFSMSAKRTPQDPAAHA